MDRRYQVFVSSTYDDLREERQEVMRALLTLDCIPTGMELFPAADDDSWTHIQRFIAGCDYYVVIVAGRYGSTGPSGTGYTEMEYDYAIQASIPVLAFLHGEPGKISVDKTEPNDEGRARLDAFRRKIRQGRHVKFWDSPSQLAGEVALGLMNLMKVKPRVGWVRGDRVLDESAALEIVRLRNKIEDLETRLSAAELAPPPGSETLSKGDEVISIRFRFRSRSGLPQSRPMPFSWNNLVSLLGPLLIGDASESDLRQKLIEAFLNHYEPDEEPSVQDEDFQKIKVQFRALGLIREVRDPTAKHGTPLRWTLTPYGDRLMTQVAAVRSSADA